MIKTLLQDYIYDFTERLLVLDYKIEINYTKRLTNKDVNLVYKEEDFNVLRELENLMKNKDIIIASIKYIPTRVYPRKTVLLNTEDIGEPLRLGAFSFDLVIDNKDRM